MVPAAFTWLMRFRARTLIINELAANDPQLAGMGTTCTALLIDGDRIEFAHIGDSRAYRLRPGADGEFEQISTDHTFVQRLLNEGRITRRRRENHPHKNVIMRVLGDVDASPELELKTLDAVPGERWVLFGWFGCCGVPVGLSRSCVLPMTCLRLLTL